MRRERRFVWLVALLLTGVLSAGADNLERLLTYRTLGNVEVSPDGARAVFVATVADLEENSMNSDLWLAELATGRSFQLTRGSKRDNAPAWSPDGKQIAFLSNRGGKANIWLIAPDGGEAEPATKFKKLSVSSFQWLPDGTGFVFTASDPLSKKEEERKKEKTDPILVDRNVKYGRLYRFTLGEKEPTKLTGEDYHISSFYVSRDGQRVVFSAQPTPRVPDFRRTDLKMLGLETGAVSDLVTRPGRDSEPRFSPDGAWVAFASAGGENDWISNTNLWVVRTDGSGVRNVSKSFDESVAGGFRWSPDGASIYYAAAQGLARRLHRIEVATGRYQPVSSHDQRRVVHGFSFSRDGSVLALALSDPSTPAEIYRLDTEADALEKLTAVNAAFVGTGPETDVLRYRSKDGLDLEGLVAKPKDLEEGKRYPLLVVIHGGPAGAFNYSFAPRRGAYPLHAFVEQGYVLFMPNPRGSSAYGERFRRANFKDWGYGDYRDIMRGVDRLIRDGVADPKRMGVMGWSYGGYMTSWVVSQTDRFKAASMGAGIGNVFSLYGNTDISDVLEAYFGTLPWQSPQTYLRSSAMNFVGNAKTPTLIQHGAEDRRVRVSQSEEYYVALKRVGVPVELVIYPRQPHGIREPRLIKDAMVRNLAWFNKWLLGIEPPEEKSKEEE